MLLFYVYNNILIFKIISLLKALLSVLRMKLLKKCEYVTIAMIIRKNNNKITNIRITFNRLFILAYYLAY